MEVLGRIIGAMKKLFIVVGAILLALTVGVLYLAKPDITNTPQNVPQVKEKKLAKYAYPELRKTSYPGSAIAINKVLKDEDQLTSYLFYFSAQGKKVSGLMNVPKQPGNYPVIVMIRGYVDKGIYETGIGTSHGGELLTQNGFITLAPDFLGYGSSDKPSTDAMEDRFLTYITTLELLSSIKNLNSALKS